MAGCVVLGAVGEVDRPAGAGGFGEICLGGVVRPGSVSEKRVKVGEKLGFTSAIVQAGGKPGGAGGMRLDEYGDLTAFVGDIFGAG